MTDSDGLARISPLNISGEVQTYQVIAFAEDYCTYVSPVTLFDDVKTDPLKIELNPCNHTEEAKSDSIANWHFESADGLPLLEEAIPGETEAVKVLYSNKRFINLRIDSSNQILRGFNVEVLEGHSDATSAITFHEEFSIFTSDIQIELPTVFESTGTPNGDFLIRLVGIPNESLGETFSTMPKLLIYGRKNVDPPALSFLNSIQVLSPVGSKSVISGLTGSKFTVSSDQCFDGQSLGLKYKNDDTVFHACSNKIAEFAAADFSFSKDRPEVGGLANIAFYLRNQFLTISKDAPSSANLLPIYVDFGRPQTAQKDFQLKLGITHAGATKGNVNSRHLFPSGELVNGVTDAVILTPGTVTEFVFRFASPEVCVTDVTAEDGESTEKLGNSVSGFTISSNSDAVTDLSQLSKCSSNSESQDRSLANSSILFPENPAEDAVFFLTLTDLAGNISAPNEIKILPCPDNVTSIPGTAICWHP